MLIQMLIIAGTATDCGQARELMKGIDVDYWLADSAYDTNVVLGACA
jgi:hypothetical protein